MTVDRTHSGAQHQFYRSRQNGEILPPFSNATGYMDAHPDEWEPVSADVARAEFALQRAKAAAAKERKLNASAVLRGVALDEVQLDVATATLAPPPAPAADPFAGVVVEHLGTSLASPIPAPPAAPEA